MRSITAVMCFSAVLASCQGQDAKFSKMVVGAWRDSGDCGQLIVTSSLSANGTFRTTCKNRNAPDAVMFYDGRWSVSNAVLVSTVTNITGASVTTTNDLGNRVSAKVPVGTTDHYKIVKATADELTLSKDGQTNLMKRMK